MVHDFCIFSDRVIELAIGKPQDETIENILKILT